jgi:aspartate aminotransferase
LDETGVAVLPGSDFGFSQDKLIFRLSYVDFDGSKFLEAKNEEIIEKNLNKFAPKIVEGIKQIVNFTLKYR